MSWSNSYIGIPFKEFGRNRDGCDCYGLVVLVYQEVLGISLASYDSDYVSCEERTEINGLFNRAVEVGPWRKLETEPQPMDLIVLRRGTMAAHCGLFIKTGWMLHVQGDNRVKAERYRAGEFKHRLIGHYGHVERMAGAS